MTLWQPGLIMTASRLQDATGWVPLTTLGTYQNGASDGSVQPMARDRYVRDEVVREFKGVVNLAISGSPSSYVFFGFDATYIPDYERNWAGAGLGLNTPFRVYLSTAGNWGLTGTISGTTSIRLDDFEIMAAIGRIAA
ncbi:hypothetical protein [Streptomyces sp. MK5]|uniref:hypothetical protein n=1 Tax=Streptomyces sp. MK5 TaxID=3064253 RepID=UPI0027406E51|nr:hypothetical protein [Streptomyces sp. MK5]